MYRPFAGLCFKGSTPALQLFEVTIPTTLGSISPDKALFAPRKVLFIAGHAPSTTGIGWTLTEVYTRCTTPIAWDPLTLYRR